MDYSDLFILLATGIITGLINIVAGGGSTLSLPVLLFLGLDSATANGTNRLGIMIQNIAAISGFQKDKLNEFSLSFKLALFTLPGAIIGALAAVEISDLWFKRILGVVMILIVLTLFIPPVPKGADQKQEQQNNWKLYFSLFGIGFYGGFIQAGVGFLLMAALFHLLRITLIKVNIHKVFIILLFNIPAFLLFLAADKVAWLPGIVLAAGNATGGWLSARISVKKGDRFIKYALASIIILMAVKLII
ncbi:MAG: sulfite exporter TauE/SafE family protein [Calditrichaceae bacterium]|nr:sulfite exporter TauE/SafE family protein [Calditrichaceae bacterium]MBN2709406.1 sulfite exporter TauE/SafE family protein [Calditrichaceae bacterium]RQV94438.1 MAG: sulfite exporter TauE/SafE family protein [Calditrichota bacterium]